MFHWFKAWGKASPVSPPIKRPSWVKEFADAEMEDRRWTPDLPQLEGKEYHWLFVPGELQKGHPCHHLLSGFEPEWPRFFTQGKFMCLKIVAGEGSKLLPFDGDLKYKNPPEMLPIRGELYKIPAAMFIPLDQYHSNGLFYYRREISVVTPWDALSFKDRQVAQNLLGHISKPKLKTVAYWRKKLHENPIVKQDMIVKSAEAESFGDDKNKMEARGFYTKEISRTLNNDQQIEKAVHLGMGNTVNSNTVWRPGVHRIWAWMYLASPHYWEDRVTLNSHPPILRYKAEGLVSRYYRFTDFEYKDDGTDAPF